MNALLITFQRYWAIRLASGLSPPSFFPCGKKNLPYGRFNSFSTLDDWWQGLNATAHCEPNRISHKVSNPHPQREPSPALRPKAGHIEPNLFPAAHPLLLAWARLACPCPKEFSLPLMVPSSFGGKLQGPHNVVQDVELAVTWQRLNECMPPSWVNELLATRLPHPDRPIFVKYFVLWRAVGALFVLLVTLVCCGKPPGRRAKGISLRAKATNRKQNLGPGVKV